MKKLLFFSIIFILSLSSCRVFNPTKMLRMGAFPEYSDLEMLRDDKLYRLAPFDQISFGISPNDGESMISGGFGSGLSGGMGAGGNMGGGIGYQIEYDGTVKLPIFGRVYVADMTVREMEKMLEEKYALLYNKPFVSSIRVTNRKVFVFRGSNQSSVVNLTHDNMTIWELIAQTGGVGDAKAHKIKLIREIDNTPHIFLIDLSRLESIQTGNIVLQNNDIVYVTPRNRFSEEIMFALTPYLSLFSTLVLIYTLFK